MDIIVSIGVSPSVRQGEDIAHLPVLKEKLAKFANTDKIAVIAIGSAMLSEICEGLYEEFCVDENSVKQIDIDDILAPLDIFNMLRVRIAIHEAYLNGAKTIFVVSNLDHVSPVPEIRWAEYLDLFHPLGFQTLFLYC